MALRADSGTEIGRAAKMIAAGTSWSFLFEK
jgi:hypothetical protein